MSAYVDRFIKQHKEYFKRNESFIISNNWNDSTEFDNDIDVLTEDLLRLSKEFEEATTKKKKQSLESEIASTKKQISQTTQNNQENKSKLFKQETDLTASILGRLSSFIKATEDSGDRKLSKVQKFIDFTVDIVDTHIKKCDDYLDYNMDVLEEEAYEDYKIDIKGKEITFQDSVFKNKIGIQDKLDELNISNDVNNIRIKFFKDEKAAIPMMTVLPLYNDDIRKLTEQLDIPKEIEDLEFYIHKIERGEKIPEWDSKKHYWEQSPEALKFWYNEWLKITQGFTVDGYFFHPWLYYHLNFYKTPVPQEDKTEPIVNPSLRDNEWYTAELLKKAEEVKNRGICLFGSRRYGKALRDDQVLHYIDGTQRPIGKAKEGEWIYGSDGKPTKILNVSPQGQVDIYEVELQDGRKSYCCEDHLWTVFDYQAKVYKTLPLKELLNQGYNYERKRKWNGEDKISIIPKYFIPMNKAVEYPEKELPIDPYYLGLWLGDGTSRSTSITTIDEGIRIWLKDFSKKEHLEYIDYKDKPDDEASVIKLVKKTGKFNHLLDRLRDLNLVLNKHIPKEYLLSSVEQRMELLRGLMDTDGTISKGGGGMSFVSADERLAKDFYDLCLSLGIACFKEKHTGNYVKKNGELNTFFKISMFTNKPVFKLQRKLDRIDATPNLGRLGRMEKSAIINIQKVGFDYATCIRVDNESKEFITNDFIVTHNSVMMSSVVEWKALIKDNASTAITSGSEGDLAELTHKIKTSMKFKVPAFKLPIQKQEWDGGVVELGLKADQQTLLEHSRHTIKNLASGAKKSSQKTAGGAPSVFLIEEIGKMSWEKAYLAAIPSFETPYGFKATVIAVGTSGESSLVGDALKAVSNPKSFKFLEMDWDMFESKVPKEYITWKRRTFASFVPGQMGYKTGFKRIPRPFGEFLGIKSEYLDKITIHQTDWKTNTEIILQERALVKNDPLKHQQEIVQFPIDPEECFLSSEKNPFPAMEAKRHKEHLESTGNVGRAVDLFRNNEGKVEYEDSTKQYPLFPFPGGTHDSPFTLYELPPDEPDVANNLYISGLDAYKHDTSDGDSLGSLVIFKRNIMDEWSDRIVASYHARPESVSEFNKNCLMLLELYGARCFPENEDMSIKDYLDRRHLTDKYLLKGVDFLSELQLNDTGNRKYGWQPTPKNKQYLLGKTIAYTKEEFKTGEKTEGDDNFILGIKKIPDVKILEEIINFNSEGNFDGITAFMSALGYSHYLDDTWVTPNIRSRSREDKPKERPKAKIGGFTKTRFSKFK